MATKKTIDIDHEDKTMTFNLWNSVTKFSFGNGHLHLVGTVDFKVVIEDVDTFGQSPVMLSRIMVDSLRRCDLN